MGFKCELINLPIPLPRIALCGQASLTDITSSPLRFSSFFLYQRLGRGVRLSKRLRRHGWHCGCDYHPLGPLVHLGQEDPPRHLELAGRFLHSLVRRSRGRRVAFHRSAYSFFSCSVALFSVRNGVFGGFERQGCGSVFVKKFPSWHRASKGLEHGISDEAGGFVNTERHHAAAVLTGCLPTSLIQEIHLRFSYRTDIHVRKGNSTTENMILS